MTLNRLLATSLLAATCLALLPEAAHAQRRAVIRRAPPARAVIVARNSPFYYNPWFQYPYGWGAWGGWNNWGGYGGPGWGGAGWGQGWGGGFSPYGGGVYNGASIRLQITPRTAEVYVDGYYAGTVDQFDGAFQRLRVEPGEHDVAVYADGFRTLRQRLYVQPLATVNLKQPLQLLQPGEAQETRPAPPTTITRVAPTTRTRRIPPAAPPTVQVEPQGVPSAEAAAPPTREDAMFGVLSVRVQPGGADVVIDGERWEGPDGDERLLVQLAPGTHRLEVRRSGYQTFTRTVDVLRGETETLNISLTRQ